MSFAGTTSLTHEKAPALGLPFRYFAASLVFLALFSLLLPFNAELFLGSFRTPGLLTMVHILTLGWITTTILGAAFQLVPVALQVGLHSERLPNALLPIYLVGIVTMLIGLWRFQTTWMIVGASLLLFVGLGYLYLLVRTLARVRHWDAVAAHVAASVFFAVLIPVLGLLLAINIRTGFLGVAYIATLKTHLLLALFGYVSLLIMGISYKLVGMFTLAEDLLPERLAWAEFALTMTGLFALTTAFYLPTWRWLGWLGGIAILAGVGLFAYILSVLYRKRRRRVFDINTPFTQTGTILFTLALVAAGLALAGWLPIPPTFWLAVGWLLLLGWVGQIIIGQMYKITPFLTWLHRYADLVGLEQVPSLDDLYNRRLALAGYGFWNAGVVVGTVAILGGWTWLMTIAAVALTVGTWIFLLNMAFVATR
jgi:hypothetical protein